MILAQDEILKRLWAGDIFRRDTWSKACLQEASYALRIARDGLLVDGVFYDPGSKYDADSIKIAPGKIAILSTEEQLVMPADLVGKIGIRLKYAQRGLTGLMGIQVDPLFGRNKPDERLYIRVANFGNEIIRLSPGDEVFSFELHQIKGAFPPRPKESTWERMKNELRYQSDASWSYVTQVESNLEKETENLKSNFQPVIMFGVFLVAVSILGAAIAVLLQTGNSKGAIELSWLSLDERRLLLWVLLIGTVGTAWVGLTAGWRFLRPYRSGTQRRNPGLIRRTWIRFWSWLW